MLKFVVCEDNPVVLDNHCKVINKAMMGNNFDYTTERFTDYCPELQQLIASPGSKVYVLDVELPSKSGIDIAREIREVDTDSIIIMSSVYESLTNRVFKDKLMILAFLSKFDKHDEELTKMVKLSMEHFGKKKTMVIDYDGVSNHVRQQDIIYITTDTESRKTVIRTLDKVFKVNKKLNDLESKLGDSFIRTHKSCIVNMTHVRAVDYKNNIITFFNGEKVALLSRTYKHAIKEWSK